MPYYQGDYYQGDYYQGDFFKKLGKGLKKLGKNIGSVAKKVAPIAGIVFPAVGAATLVGRGITAVSKARSIAGALTSAAPNPNQTPILIASQMTGQSVGIPSVVPTPGISAASSRIKRIRRAKKSRKAQSRAGYRRRKATTRRRYR